MFSFKRIALPPVIGFVIVIVIVIGDSVARELRPSYHGLEYQSSPPKLPPKMKEFFGSSSPASQSSSTALPKAMNSSNDNTWWNGVSGKNGGDKGRDRLRHVLLVASLACGVTGAALLAVSGFIYLHRRHKEPSSSSRDNSKAIVVRK